MRKNGNRCYQQNICELRSSLGEDLGLGFVQVYLQERKLALPFVDMQRLAYSSQILWPIAPGKSRSYDYMEVDVGSQLFGSFLYTINTRSVTACRQYLGSDASFEKLIEEKLLPRHESLVSSAQIGRRNSGAVLH